MNNVQHEDYFFLVNFSHSCSWNGAGWRGGIGTPITFINLYFSFCGTWIACESCL